MESTPFEFTPEQKGLLESLSRETGKPVSVLIAEALEELREHVRHEQRHEATNGSGEEQPALPPKIDKPIWEEIIEASRRIPEEELEDLPTDLAANVDHYVYGLPKRSQ